MSYWLKTTFEDDFAELIMFLRGKYPKQLFNIDGIGDEQVDFSAFSKKYFSTKTTVGDLSIDANANVDDISIANYNAELPKALFKLNSYYVLWKKLKQLYGLQKANQLVEDQLTGQIYINDMHGLGAGMSYCFNFTTYDVALQGLPMVRKIKSVAPKYLYSFKSQLEQFVVVASNSIMGACGLADLVIVMSLYIDKILQTGEDAGFFFDGWFSDTEKEKIQDKLADVKYSSDYEIETLKFTENINKELNKTGPANKKIFDANVWKYVKENLVSFIYTINQPNRSGAQSPFTNVSIYDKYFLEQMAPSYILFERNANIDTINKLQFLYLDVMNDELRRTPVTFPVSTACFVVDDNNDILDDEFLHQISLKNLEHGFINLYCGKSSTLSSCCRLRSDSENKMFKDNIEYELKLEDGTTKTVKQNETIKVKELSSGKERNMYVNEIIDKLDQYDLIA